MDFDKDISDYRFYLSDFGVVDENGNILKGEEMVKFLKDRSSVPPTIEEKLEIGDVVKLKLTNDIVTIAENDGDPFLYKGKSSSNGRLLCFNQNQIEKIISKKNENSYTR